MSTKQFISILLVATGLLAYLFFSAVWPKLEHYLKGARYIRNTIADRLDVVHPASTVFGAACRVLGDMALAPHPLAGDHPPCVKYGFTTPENVIRAPGKGMYLLRLGAEISRLRQRPADAVVVVVYDERSRRWHFALLGNPSIRPSEDTSDTVPASHLGCIEPAPLKPPNP